MAKVKLVKLTAYDDDKRIVAIRPNPAGLLSVEEIGESVSLGLKKRTSIRFADNKTYSVKESAVRVCALLNVSLKP